ncbi:MAG: cytochrome C oxidase subunit IV family protein [Elusimicrobiota bacterium]|nr:cytochrome C oxidase subunit IV family protein [Elusimicrobiota bacterium]
MAKTSAAQHDDHAPNVKLYMGVFAALMVLTVVTVWISKFHLSIGSAVALGMFVASVKAGLVAAVFMHLWGEKKLIYYALGLTVFFGAFLVIGLIDARLTRGNVTTPMDVKAQGPAHAPAHGEAPAEAGAHH